MSSRLDRMAIALETFIKQLAESGVLSVGKLENFVPPKASPKDAQELARDLVRSQQLTKYQAQEIYAGRAKSLILGNYTILDRIGAGGMGQVFKAHHRRMDRLVAIKMLPTAMVNDPLALARFQREVEAAAKLRHPNIVAADDADEANGVHFLVLEYVDGSDLSALVKKQGPLPVDKAIDCILQAARGLEFAHKKGVIHRDIKPANLLLDGEGTVKILDMGLARISADGNAATQAELTGTGAVMGTVDYMAPEQAISTKHADARSDIYSLGVTLWYLLTGKAMYEGDTMVEKLMGHQAKPIPLLGEARPEIPDELECVYQRMVAKSADDRYQTMSEVIAKLTACSSQALSPESVQQSSIASDSGLLSFLKEVPAPTTNKTTHKSAKNTPIKPPTETKLREPALPDDRKRQQKKLTLILGGGALALAGILATVFAFRENADRDAAPKQASRARNNPAQPFAEKISSAKPSKPAANFALEFDGKDDLVELPRLPLQPDDSVTFEAWFEPSESPVPFGVVIRCQFTAEVGYFLRLDHGNTMHFISEPTGARMAAPATRARMHVAGSFDKKDGNRLYVNGRRTKDPGDFAGSYLIPGAPLRNTIGADFHNPATQCWYHGRIDEIRISRGVRYRHDFDPSNPLSGDRDTVALYHFDEGQGDVLTDSSGNNHHGKIAGAKWVRVDKPSATPTNPSPTPITDISDPSLQQWMKDVAAMPAEQQVDAVSEKLKELNPVFDGKLSMPEDQSRAPLIEDGNVVELLIFTENVADLSPLRALSELRRLSCLEKQNTGRRLNLSPLNGMKIRALGTVNVILDLSTVKGLPLSELASINGIRDVTPLAGMPLQKLMLSGNWNLTSLEPLKGMQLTSFIFDNCQVSDLSPLSEMPLKVLMCHVTQVADLSPLKEMPLEELACDRTLVTDLSPLAGMKLKKLSFTPNSELKGVEGIRQMDSLTEIGTSYDKLLPRDEFWRRYDAGEFWK